MQEFIVFYKNSDNTLLYADHLMEAETRARRDCPDDDTVMGVFLNDD